MLEAPFALGIVRFSVTLDTPVGGAELCALATDLPRYADIEPRLSRAEWLTTGAPQPGSRAVVVGDIPFAVAAIRSVIGHPRGVATLEEFDPPRHLLYSLSTPRAIGALRASFSETAGKCIAVVDGWIMPRRRLGRLALTPLTGLLRELADESVRRGLCRAIAAVTAGESGTGS
jgi:hypothetical protein